MKAIRVTLAMSVFAGLAIACGATQSVVYRAASPTIRATSTAQAAPAVGTAALICSAKATITLTDSMFAERVGISLPATTGDKFLLVSLSASTNTDTPIDGEQELKALDANDRSYSQVLVYDSTEEFKGVAKAGAPLVGKIAFEVPPATQRVKLVFDNGCQHNEWTAPAPLP